MRIAIGFLAGVVLGLSLIGLYKVAYNTSQSISIYRSLTAQEKAEIKAIIECLK